MNQPRTLTALSHCLAELSTLNFADADTPRFRDWRAFTLKTLAELPGANTPAIREFDGIAFAPTLPASREEQEQVWRTGRNAAYTLLTTLRFQPHTGVNEPESQP